MKFHAAVLTVALAAPLSDAFVAPMASTRLPVGDVEQFPVNALSAINNDNFQNDDNLPSFLASTPTNNLKTGLLTLAAATAISLTTLPAPPAIAATPTAAIERQNAKTAAPATTTTTKTTKAKDAKTAAKTTTKAPPLSPAEKERLAAKKNFDLSLATIKEYQKYLSEAKLNSSKADAQLKNAEKAAKQAKAILVSDNDKLAAAKNQRMPGSAVAELTAKVSKSKAFSNNADKELAIAKTKKANAEKEVKQQTSNLEDAQKGKDKAMKRVKKAEQKYKEYQKQVAKEAQQKAKREAELKKKLQEQEKKKAETVKKMEQERARLQKEQAKVQQELSKLKK